MVVVCMGMMVLVVVVGIGGAVAGLVVGIVLGVQRRWRGALVAAALMVLSGVIAVGSGVAMVAKAGMDVTAKFKQVIAEDRARDQERERQRVQRGVEIKALTPDADWTQVREEWWEFPGEIDWWRVPMRWPYDMHSVDRLRTGGIGRNESGGRSAHLSDVRQMGFSVDAYAFDRRICVYRSNADGVEGRAREWGIFFFDSEKKEAFGDEAAMWRAAKAAGWEGREELKTVWEQYKAYWGFEVWQPK